jgi:hypothetical protein
MVLLKLMAGVTCLFTTAPKTRLGGLFRHSFFAPAIFCLKIFCTAALYIVSYCHEADLEAAPADIACAGGCSGSLCHDPAFRHVMRCIYVDTAVSLK